jgi:L-fuconolactonase
MSVLKQDYLPEHLETELSKLSFDGCIAVQARQTLKETEWLLRLAGENEFIKGVVGWVDLCSREVELQLNHFSEAKKLVGIRHVIHDEPDVDFMLRTDFLKGIAYLKQFGLVYELLLFPEHLANAIKLVTMFPRQTFVLDHISKPDIKGGNSLNWAKEIKMLAQYPNVHCKLSGMVTEADWKNWTPKDIYPYLDVVFEAFGTKRLMIGSDWPVCKVAGEYRKVMDVVVSYVEKLEESERALILGGNAVRIYKLK